MESLRIWIAQRESRKPPSYEIFRLRAPSFSMLFPSWICFFFPAVNVGNYISAALNGVCGMCGHPRHQEIEENIEGLGAKKASELTEATGVRR